MLLLPQVFEAIGHVLNNADAPRMLDASNRAGAILYSDPWRWLDHRLWTASIAANSERIVLPAAVGSVTDVQSATGAGLGAYTFTPDYSRIQRAKAIGAIPYLIAPFHEPDANGESVAFLAVWPVPTATQSGALTVLGRARWVNMTNETIAVPLPAELPIFEALFVEYARAYAVGYERPERTSVEEQLAMVRAGAIYGLAREADRRQFSKSAPAQNTAVAMAMASRRRTVDDVIWSEPPAVDNG